MIPLVARYLVLPLHEWLIGRRTFAFLRSLEESQWLSPADLRALQERKMRALFRHAHSRIPFFRRRFEKAGIDVMSASGADMLSSLPLLEKEDIRCHATDMLWREAPGGLIESSTGGSSGQPLVFHLDRRRQAYDQAARMRAHRWFRVEVGDRELYLWGSPIEVGRADRLKRIRDGLSNHRLLDAFNMTPRRMDAYLDVLERYRPASLFGYPSSLTLLVEYARSRGREVRLPGLRAIFVTGEVCYAYNRESLSTFFNVPIADGYGSREAGFIAHECPEGSLHITAENVVVEIVEDGRVVPQGESGEIVVTHLDAYAMPFIRYRTGDVGRLLPGRCSCGRGLPLMDVVHGRTTDFLHFPDGCTKHALSVIYPLRAMQGVRQFRVVQHEDYSVTVDVVRDDRHQRITREAVAQGVRSALGDRIDLRVRMVKQIETSASGKYRYVISHATPAHRQSREEGSVRAV